MCGLCRLQLGLAEAPPASAEPAEGEWVDLRPRWPLTDRKDERRWGRGALWGRRHALWDVWGWVREDGGCRDAWALPRSAPLTKLFSLHSPLCCSFSAPRSAKKKRIFTSLTALMKQEQEHAAEAVAAAEAGMAPTTQQF